MSGVKTSLYLLNIRDLGSKYLESKCKNGRTSKVGSLYSVLYGNVLKRFKRAVCKTVISAVRIRPLPPKF